MTRRRNGTLVVALVPVAALVLATLPAGAAGAAGSRATTDRSPVDLATPVDFGAALARPSAIVDAGPARFEVLTPTLIRLEYSPTERFENSPTVNVVDRRMAVPRYVVRRSGGWLTIQTAGMVLRYRLGSGPFTVSNTTLRFSVGGKPTTVHPTWDDECTFDQVCQAGAAELGGGATFRQSQVGYLSTGGFVGYFRKAGASATWSVLGAPAGPAVLTLRYTDPPLYVGDSVPRTFDLEVDGSVTQLTAAPTDATAPWSTLREPIDLRAGTNLVELRCAPGENCADELDTLGWDTLSVAPVGSPAPVVAQTGPLGGWIRGFDTATYASNPTCTDGEQGDTCQAGLEPLNTDGLLDEAGWRLLDDSQSAVWTRAGWVAPRTPGGDVQDGYLFAYGHDYIGALHELEELTGPAPLLPRAVFGVWYSDYTPYSSAAIENSVYPAFAAHQVPLNTLSLDTDWKAPNDWNGWEWNASLFPSPRSFLSWAHEHGIEVTLNIHSSIDDNDPALPLAQRIAGGALAASSCSEGPCKVWDWSSVDQAESNFALQQSFERQGVAFWWLDWCCDDSVASMTGITPDWWIDHLYAQEMVDRGTRGFVLARIGGSNAEPEDVYPAGPWSAHTTGIAFTGDAWGTWNTLAQEVALTPAEATIGEPYVSDDIGSYLGPPPTQSGADPPDLYDRWVQFGTFQPILRLHSNNEDRLPWEYPEPVQSITEAFLRLREDLIPYTYALAAESHETGAPMTRPLYLDDPDDAAAYDYPQEYLYGPDVLVAPVTVPGDDPTVSVWLPSGRWIDYFTGATFTGPGTVSMTVPLSRLPVFVKAGGIVPEQDGGDTGGDPNSALTIRAYAGGSGSFDLYDDAGSGLGYTKGERADTEITTSSASQGGAVSTKVTIEATKGRFPGQAAVSHDRIEIVDVSLPSSVTVDGRAVPERSAGTGPGWSYQAATATATVVLPSTPISSATTVVERGGSPVERAEPPPGTAAS
ncbi:MAG: TIM-barrel domain-containing protein [Acidimicrobiales bacterium]